MSFFYRTITAKAFLATQKGLSLYEAATTIDLHIYKVAIGRRNPKGVKHNYEIMARNMSIVPGALHLDQTVYFGKFQTKKEAMKFIDSL